jgi:hypothetical protein
VFDWLFDGCLTVSLVLGAAGVGLAVAWWRTRYRAFGGGFVVVLVLLGLYILLLFLYGETAREQIERKVKEMVAGVDRKDVEAIFKHISDRFELTQGSQTLDKQGLRRYAEEALRRPELRGMLVTDVAVGTIDREKGKAPVGFMVKILGSNEVGDLFYRVDAEFTLDPDKQWRMKTFKLFRPLGEHNEPVPLPTH